MYKRYYDGYGSQRNNVDRGEIIVPENSHTYEDNEVKAEEKTGEIAIASKPSGVLGSSLELDDLILIGLLIFLLQGSDEADPILLIVIGYLLISEIL